MRTCRLLCVGLTACALALGCDEQDGNGGGDSGVPGDAGVDAMLPFDGAVAPQPELPSAAVYNVSTIVASPEWDFKASTSPAACFEDNYKPSDESFRSTFFSDEGTAVLARAKEDSLVLFWPRYLKEQSGASQPKSVRTVLTRNGNDNNRWQGEWVEEVRREDGCSYLYRMLVSLEFAQHGVLLKHWRTYRDVSRDQNYNVIRPAAEDACTTEVDGCERSGTVRLAHQGPFDIGIEETLP